MDRADDPAQRDLGHDHLHADVGEPVLSGVLRDFFLRSSRMESKASKSRLCASLGGRMGPCSKRKSVTSVPFVLVVDPSRDGIECA
jgi:hypothetical protein